MRLTVNGAPADAGRKPLKRISARDPRRVALTPALARDLQFDPVDRKRTIYWDTHRDSVKGFALIVSRSGHRSYAYQYYSAGQYRRPTLGDASKLSLSATHGGWRGVCRATLRAAATPSTLAGPRKRP